MKQWISRFVRVRATYSSTGEQQQAQRLLILNLAWLFVIIAALPLIIWWIIDGVDFANPQWSDLSIDAGTVFIPLSVVLTGLTHWLIQHGHLNRARLCFVWNALIFALLTIFPDYRIDSPFILVLTLPVTAAGVLLRRTGLFSVAIFVILVIVVGGYIQVVTGMEATPLSGNNKPNEAIQVTIFIVLSLISLDTIMLWTFVSTHEDTANQQRYLTSLIEVEKNISQTLSTLPSGGEELNRAVEQIRDAFGLYHVQIFLTDAASGLAVLQASTGFIGRRLLEEESLLTPDENSPVNDALRQADPILIRETAAHEKHSGFLPATRSELLIPLHVSNLLPMGVLDLHSTALDTFSKSVLETLSAIGNHLAAAIYAAQQAKDAHSIRQEREQLLDRIDANQRELARVNRQLIGLTWGSYLEERRGVVPSFQWQEGVVSPTASAPIMLDSTLQDGRPRLEMRDGEHVLCIPIQLRGQTLGAVEFRRSSEVGWSPSALELAQAVADRMALSLENARLFEQAQTTARREQLVSQVTAQLQSTNNLQDLLTLAAAQFQEALGATRTQVHLGLPTLDSSTDQA